MSRKASRRQNSLSVSRPCVLMTVIFQIIVREFEFVIQQPNLVADEIMAASHPGNPLSMIWHDMKTAGLVALAVTLFLFGAGDANAQTAAKVADGDFETTRLTSNYKHNPEVGPGQPWIFTGHSGLARISSEGFHVPGPSTGQCGFLQSPNSSFSQSVHFPTAGDISIRIGRLSTRLRWRRRARRS